MQERRGWDLAGRQRPRPSLGLPGATLQKPTRRAAPTSPPSPAHPQPVGRCVRRARKKCSPGAGPAGGGAAGRLAESGRLGKCRTPDLPASLSSRAHQGCSPSWYVRSPEGAACVSSWEGAARSSVESLPGFVRRRHLTRWSSHS